MLVKAAAGVDVIDPSVIIKCFSELADVIIVERVNV